MPDRPLFTVRSGEGGFRVVACTARQALVHVAELKSRGLADVNVAGPDGQRREIAELEALVASVPERSSNSKGSNDD